MCRGSPGVKLPYPWQKEGAIHGQDRAGTGWSNSDLGHRRADLNWSLSLPDKAEIREHVGFHWLLIPFLVQHNGQARKLRPGYWP